MTPLPEPILDDLRFQKDLVDEARRRIIQYCPEWTDYNVSDPGITLIELFAWMTELMTYRLNLVPEKNYIRFLDMLGIRLQPANSARAELMFRLSAPFPISAEEDVRAVVPRGVEVATRRNDAEEEAIFTTDQPLQIVPPRLVQLRRADDFNKNYLPRLGIEVFHAFTQPKPAPGDTFYLGFDESNDIRGHILQISVLCEETQATGIRREDPPLVWECSLGNGQWQEIPPSTAPGERDTTGGLNNERGRVLFYLPLTLKPDQVHGRSCFWVRCRLEQRQPSQGMYTQSPRIKRIEAHTLGAATMATHAVIVRGEEVGASEGEPGQVFRLRNAPVLELRDGEGLEVEENRDGDLVFVPWTRVDDFSESDRFDRHYTLDTATGEIAFGPGIRQRDGSVRQYGRVPEAYRRIRFSQYRYGGGVAGNVPTGRIQVLKTAIPYIDRVINPRRAEGGRDPETLEEAKQRARRDIRAQKRAVTAEDFEYFALRASRLVGRARCSPPRSTAPAGTVDLLIIPAAFDSVALGDYTQLALDEPLKRTVQQYLDQYRLLTTTLTIREPAYIGVKVDADIVVNEYVQPDLVVGRVLDRLKEFITPLASGAPSGAPSGAAARDEEDELMGSRWQGWPFGRSLYLSEVFSLIQNVRGVKHVRDVRLSQRQVMPSQEGRPGGEAESPAGNAGALVPAARAPALAPVADRLIAVPGDAVLCSLRHEVHVVEI